MLSDRGVAYLANRGISVDTAVRYELFTARGHDGAHAEPTADDAADYLGIPFFRGGERVWVQFRDMRENVPHEQRYMAPKGTKPAIWNFDAIDDPGLDGKALSICEGPLDAIAVCEAGAQRVIGIPGAGNFGLVEAAETEFAEVDSIILITDADADGEKLKNRLLDILSAARCKGVKYPAGCKDAGEVLQHHGRDGIRAMLKSAAFVQVPGYFRARNAPRRAPLEVMKIASFGAEFQSHIGICRRQLSIWTGEPGGGKTTLVKAVLWALAKEHGWGSAPAFFEDDTWAHTIPDMQRLYFGREPATDEESELALDWVDKNIGIIEAPDDQDATIEYFIEAAKAAVTRDGVSIVVADPWSQFEIQDARFSETEMTRRYIIKLRDFAKRFNVHVAIVAHPRKHNEYGGTEKMATGNDVAGSLHFRGRCDLGVTIAKDTKAENIANVLVWKVRRAREMGKEGQFSLQFDDVSGRYSHISQEERAWARGEDPTIVHFETASRKRRGRRNWQQD